MTILTPFDMYDSTVPANIPQTAQYVAGYVDGAWPWMRTQPSLFPNAKKLSIAVFASDDANCLDIESGNATPTQAPGWVIRQRSRGKDPWIYCSRLSTYGWQAVQNAFNAAKVTHPWYWIADYGSPRQLLVLNGITCIAHQYVDVGPYDLTCLSDTAIKLLGGTVTDPFAVQYTKQGTDDAGNPQTGTISMATMLAWFDNNMSSIRRGIAGIANSIGVVDADTKTAQAEIDTRLVAILSTVSAIKPDQPLTDVQVNNLATQLSAILPGADAAELARRLANPPSIP